MTEITLPNSDIKKLVAFISRKALFSHKLVATFDRKGVLKWEVNELIEELTSDEQSTEKIIKELSDVIWDFCCLFYTEGNTFSQIDLKVLEKRRRSISNIKEDSIETIRTQSEEMIKNTKDIKPLYNIINIVSQRLGINSEVLVRKCIDIIFEKHQSRAPYLFSTTRQRVGPKDVSEEDTMRNNWKKQEQEKHNIL